MGEYHQLRDGNIAVRRDDGSYYLDSIENFVKDGGPQPQALPLDADERIYTQGKRHAIMKAHDVIDGGPRVWPDGDAIIARCASYIAAQTARREAEAAESDKRMQAQFGITP